MLRQLAAGACVALPSESTYEIVASALNPEAAARLHKIGPPAIVVSDYPQLFDWLPQLRGAGARLFRKMRAGPIVLQADMGFSSGLWSRLPAAVRQIIMPQGELAIRWPVHPIWDELPALDLPLISVRVAGGHSADETVRSAGDDLACVVDGGPTQFANIPTVVRAEGRRCRVQQEGVLTREQIDELALCRILFICTGNTCRSPMAAGLCARLLADRLGCAPGELNQHGFLVQSAGLSAMMGGLATPDAVRVAADLGADLSRHRSVRLDLDMLAWSDHVFAMTASHEYALKSVPVDDLPVPRLLSSRDVDVADPIGGELADYRAVRQPDPGMFAAALAGAFGIVRLRWYVYEHCHRQRSSRRGSEAALDPRGSLHGA